MPEVILTGAPKALSLDHPAHAPSAV